MFSGSAASFFLFACLEVADEGAAEFAIERWILIRLWLLFTSLVVAWGLMCSSNHIAWKESLACRYRLQASNFRTLSVRNHLVMVSTPRRFSWKVRNSSQACMLFSYVIDCKISCNKNPALIEFLSILNTI